MYMHEPTKHLCTREEAARIVRRVLKAKGRCHLSVWNPAPIEDKPDHVFPGGLHTSIKLGWNEAMRVCENILSETLEKRGARIPVRVYEAEPGKTYSRPSVWIG